MARKNKSNNTRAIAITLIVIVSLVLIVSAVSMLIQYSKEVGEQASSKAAYNTLITKQEVEDALDEYVTKAKVTAENVSALTTQGELSDYLSKIQANPTFSDVLLVRYYKDDVLYSDVGDVFNGEDVTRSFHEKNRALPAGTAKQAGYAGSFPDDTTVEGRQLIVGFYAPVSGSELADAVVIYYTRETLTTYFSTNLIKEKEDAEFSLLCTAAGEVIVGQAQVESSELFTAIRTRVGDKTPVDQVGELMRNGQSGTVSAKIGTADYLISVGADADRMQDLCVVELYRADVLYASSFAFIDAIEGIFVIFAVIAVFVVIYLMIHRAVLRRELLDLETEDKKLGCFNRHGFEKEAGRILERNKTPYFAVVLIQLRHYKYLMETYGEAETDHLLAYLRLITSKSLQMEETYGHIEGGQFLMLIHAKDRQALLERLKNHAAVATHYKGTYKFDVLLKYGIYEREHNDLISVTQMIDFANEANNSIQHATAQNAAMQFNFYSNEIRKIRLINEDMELRMEGALQNGEFQVFYQPKYNLNQTRQDGSEALVRWYDPKTNEYNRPALFMPLFESNGFIVKLDKYVYTKVCEYISYSIEMGRKVFPVSVNVSRITAVQPDFIEYYTKIKKKYGIVDGQIMIEFTESFAYENYETLFTITEALHKNGFKCSIDDFGHGYSSYRILKSLPMDEIKLDKFFIEKGQSEERDSYIIESIIGVAKKLGMKVTQEGVETYEDVVRLKRLGCDVIQGYYYSHPLPLTDYLSFVATTREHNIEIKQ